MACSLRPNQKPAAWPGIVSQLGKVGLPPGTKVERVAGQVVADVDGELGRRLESFEALLAGVNPAPPATVNGHNHFELAAVK
jgi:hypothetical protein